MKLLWECELTSVLIYLYDKLYYITIYHVVTDTTISVRVSKATFKKNHTHSVRLWLRIIRKPVSSAESQLCVRRLIKFDWQVYLPVKINSDCQLQKTDCVISDSPARGKDLVLC